MATNVRLIKISEEAHSYIELLKIFYFPEMTYAQVVDKLIADVELKENYKAKLVEY